MKRKIELYGRLREAGLGDALELPLKPGATAAEALARLAERLGPEAGLLKGAVLATDSEILRSADRLPKSGRLAALPPVCGG
jgi:molybdopterin converting factor small subunit